MLDIFENKVTRFKKNYTWVCGHDLTEKLTLLANNLPIDSH